MRGLLRPMTQLKKNGRLLLHTDGSSAWVCCSIHMRGFPWSGSRRKGPCSLLRDQGRIIVEAHVK